MFLILLLSGSKALHFIKRIRKVKITGGHNLNLLVEQAHPKPWFESYQFVTFIDSLNIFSQFSGIEGTIKNLTSFLILFLNC